MTTEETSADFKAPRPRGSNEKPSVKQKTVDGASNELLANDSCSSTTTEIPTLNDSNIEESMKDSMQPSESISDPSQFPERSDTSIDSCKNSSYISEIDSSSMPSSETTEISIQSGTRESHLQSLQQLAESVKTSSENDDSTKPEGNSVSIKAHQFSMTSPSVQLPSDIPYSVPDWSGLCTENYSLDVLKNGVIISTISLCSRPTHVLGRLSSCHLVLEHPSLSRFHAILQYRALPEGHRAKGWYLFDLESTHGTVVNKVKVRPMEFHRIRVGHVMKFGGSSRLYIMQGPEEDREIESETTYSQYMEYREKKRNEAEEKMIEMEKEKTEKSNSDCGWGFMEDAVEDEVENVFEMADEPKHEDQYSKDPKRTLRGYFEREGYDQPEYEFLDAGFGKHHCRVELLPLQSSGSGRSTYAEAIISGGKKKEAVTACALEACRMLDRMGELFKAATSQKQRRLRDWEANEYYDSDEDIYLDRTGDIERKREKRMALAGKWPEEKNQKGGASVQQVDTFESLTKEFAVLGEQIREIEATLERSRKQIQGGDSPATSELDALDAYMEGIKAGALDRRSRMALKMRLTGMRRQSDVLRKRLQAVAPNFSILAMRTTKHVNTSSTTDSMNTKSSPVDESIKQSDDSINPTAMVESKKSNASSLSTGRMRFSIKNAFRRPAPNPLQMDVAPEPSDTGDVVEDEEEEEITDTVTKTSTMEAKSSPSCPSSNSNVPPVHDQVEMKTKVETPVLLPARPQTKFMEADETQDEEKRKRRKRTRPAFTENLNKTKEDTFPDDPDYVCWVPPANQSGDGETSLNARFGY